MHSRRKFIRTATTLTVGAYLLPPLLRSPASHAGVQLYSVRKEMLADPVATLKQLAKIGYKELESARSEKGNYYGLTAKEMKKVTHDLGMRIRSGHVGIDENWLSTLR